MHHLQVLVFVAGLAAGCALAEGPANTERPGRMFFEQQVVPKLGENGCPMCHAVGYVQPNVLIYEHLLPYLAMGDAPEKTPVLRKLANLHAIRTDLPTHPGGQRCATLNSEPCKTITEWWGIEFGESKSEERE